MCSRCVPIFADFCQLPANLEFANADSSWLPGWNYRVRHVLCVFLSQDILRNAHC